MKNTLLEKIKDEVAKIHGFQSWNHANQNSTITENPKVIDKVAQRYANEKLKLAAESANLWVETPFNGTELNIITEQLGTPSYPMLQTITVFKQSILKHLDEL